MSSRGSACKPFGKVWCAEDNPKTRAIEKLTLKVTNSDEGFGKHEPGQVKVGPLNWTHSNAFVNMVVDRAPCHHPSLPVRDGKLDSDSILQDPRNARLKEYIEGGCGGT